MNYEEARKLKKGTPLLIRTKAVSVDIAGDILYETRARDQEYEVMYAKTGYQYADIQTPEHNLGTCRLFKKGDIVREVSWNGIEPKGLGNIYEVEANDGTVIMLRNNPCNIALAPCFLELVCSMDKKSTCDAEHEIQEESTGNRFKVVNDNIDTYSHRVKDTHTSRTVAIFPYCNPPFDDELTDRAIVLRRAVDYCDYLNKTYASEQRRQKL